MIEAEISLKISTFFEPKPGDKGSIYPNYYSTGGWWKSMNCKQIDVGEYERGGWQPRHYTDPVIVVQLLKWLIERRFDVDFSWIRESECVGDIPHLCVNEARIPETIIPMRKDLSDIELAIALAVCAEIDRRKS